MSWIKIMLITIIFSLISITSVLATPACTGESLFVREVKQSSELMNVTNTNMNSISEVGKEADLSYILRVMHIDEKYDNSTFKILLVDDQSIMIYESKLELLKSWSTLNTDNYTRKVTYIFYEFPARNFSYRLYNIDANLSHFDNKTFVIKLDDTVLREYVIGYKPALCGGPHQNTLLNTVYELGITIFTIFSLFIAPVILVIIIILHIKNRLKKAK